MTVPNVLMSCRSEIGDCPQFLAGASMLFWGLVKEAGDKGGEWLGLGKGQFSTDDLVANGIGVSVGRGLCKNERKDPQKPCEKRCRKRLMRRLGRLGD